MIINISIDTNEERMSGYEQSILMALAGIAEQPEVASSEPKVKKKKVSPQAKAVVVEPEELEKAPEKAEKPAKAEPAASEDPEPAEEPTAKAEKVTTTPEDAVKRATELVQKKKASEIKAALTKLGVSRVSELGTVTQRNKFMELLKDL